MTEILVQGDTAPDIEAVIHEPGNPNAPIDLTDATVNFQMRKADDRRYQINGNAEIVGDPTQGRVKYELGDPDLNVPGDYQAQFEVTYVDNKIQTTRTPIEITIRRQ